MCVELSDLSDGMFEEDWSWDFWLCCISGLSQYDDQSSKVIGRWATGNFCPPPVTSCVSCKGWGQRVPSDWLICQLSPSCVTPVPRGQGSTVNLPGWIFHMYLQSNGDKSYIVFFHFFYCYDQTKFRLDKFRGKTDPDVKSKTRVISINNLSIITFRAFKGCEMTYRLELNQADHKKLLSDFIQVCPFLYFQTLFTPVLCLRLNMRRLFSPDMLKASTRYLYLRLFSSSCARHIYAFTTCPCLDVQCSYPCYVLSWLLCKRPCNNLQLTRNGVRNAALT